MQGETQNPVNIIRFQKREDIKEVRNKHKENILFKKRLRLNEIADYVHDDMNPTEFKELFSKLKLKNLPLEVIRKLKNSCNNFENIEYFFRSDGALNSIIRIVTGSNAQKQVEAVACLTNLACGSHKYCYKVAKSSGAYLAAFIDGSNYLLQDQSAWAIGNIANDCLDCFNIIKSQGIIPALFKILKSPASSVVQSAVFALNACTQYEDLEIIYLIQDGLLNHLFSLLDFCNFNRLAFLDIAFTISNCCCLSSKFAIEAFDLDNIELIMNTVIKITQNPDIDILIATPFVRCLGFLSSNDKVCELISEHSKFLESVQVIISTEAHLPLKKELMWVLSNVIVQRMIPSKYIISLIDCLKCFVIVENAVTMQVFYFLTSLASTTDSMRLLLRQHEIFSSINCLLQSKQIEIKQAATVFLATVEHH